MSVLVILEQTRGVYHRMSWEALAAARELGGPVTAAVVLGEGGAVGAAAEGNADRVITLAHPHLAAYTADGYTAAFAALVEREKPEWVVLPHTYQTRDWAPKLATRCGRPLVTDVIQLRAEGIAVRQLFQGKLNADYRFEGEGPRFVSIQAGAYAPAGAGTPTVEEFAVEVPAPRGSAEPPFREAARAVDLTQAEIIVAVGRGIQDKENLFVIEELAEALGAEIAASRPICDNGWLPMDRQVGSSGQTVAPKVYFAIGISGAIQHLVGMKGSRTIVAINKDPNAPIFEVADYGVVGDLFEVVPALTEAIRKHKGL